MDGNVMKDRASWITICDTCKHEDWANRDLTLTDGEALAALIEAAATDAPGVRTRRHSCLMGCTRACNVAIQGSGKLNYTLGGFDVSTDAAAGIVAYAALHAASDSGTVPYRDWPAAVKGHFVTRHPPLPTDGAPDG